MKQADNFRQLADKIDKNDESDFAGAFMIVPPSGDPVQGFMVGNADLATFWSVVKSKVEIIMVEINDKDRQASAYGGRR